MPSKKPSWQEKLNNTKGNPKVEVMSGRMRKKWGAGTIVIPAPIEVDQLMRKVPKGKLITISEIRATLATKHHATIGCQLTTGIFAWMSAHAAEEQQEQGATEITPYGRTLKTGGILNEKYPGGVESNKRLLEREGHMVIPKGIKFFVKDYLQAVISLESLVDK